jgi:hypothetical protein
MGHHVHDEHGHVHSEHCGHTRVRHDGHYDEHVLEVSAANPADCAPTPCGCDHAGCGHEKVPHGDHTDYLVGGRLHHPHGDHCDDHGPVELE